MAIEDRDHKDKKRSPNSSKRPIIAVESELPISSSWKQLQEMATFSSSRYALLEGDVRKCLEKIPQGSIDTCLTSPPYWGARDYGHPDQTGLEEELEDYVATMVSVFRSVKRVLSERGTLWLNIGDCYLNGTGTVNGRPPEKGWKRNKQLCLVPFRLALALQEDGWWLRNTVVWAKPNAMPASVRDRLTNTWEPVFLFTKSEKYHFDLDSLRVPHQTDDSVERQRAERGKNNGKAKGSTELRKWLNSPRHRATIDGLRAIRRRPNRPDPTELAAYLLAAAKKKDLSTRDIAKLLNMPYERTRHYFRTDRLGARLPPEEVWEQLRDLLELDTQYDDAMAVEVGDNVFRNHPKGKNPGDIASFALSGSSISHFATMPMALVEWALKATLPAGGVAFDPFMGTGTTGIAALRLGGRFVGVDVRKDFLKHFVDWAKSIQSRDRQPPLDRIFMGATVASDQ
jgi:DNA modification methylase